MPLKISKLMKKLSAAPLASKGFTGGNAVIAACLSGRQATAKAEFEVNGWLC